MFHRTTLGSLFMGLALVMPAAAQVTLSWKFAEGDTFFVKEEFVGKTTVTAKGKKPIEELSTEKPTVSLPRQAWRETTLSWSSEFWNGRRPCREDRSATRMIPS